MNTPARKIKTGHHLPRCVHPRAPRSEKAVARNCVAVYSAAKSGSSAYAAPIFRCSFRNNFFIDAFFFSSVTMARSIVNTVLKPKSIQKSCTWITILSVSVVVGNSAHKERRRGRSP